MSDPFQVSTPVYVFAFPVAAPKGQLLTKQAPVTCICTASTKASTHKEMKIRQCRSANTSEGGMLMLSDPTVEKNILFTA